MFDAKVILSHQMRKLKIKNLSHLSYQSKIPLKDLEILFKGDLTDKKLDTVDVLKGFFGCKLSSLLVNKKGTVTCSGDSYDPISGVVYFIRNNNTCLTKIGFTRDLLNRLQNLSYEHKGDMELIHYVASFDSAGLEKMMHNVFKDKRVDGEWFNLSEDDLLIIKDSKEKEDNE